MNDLMTSAPAGQSFGTDSYEPLTRAQSADYDSTHRALLTVYAAGSGSIAFTQSRVVPDPESLFGRYCAEHASQLRTATGEEPAHHDRSVSLRVMLNYNYGLSLPESISASTIQDLIDKLAKMKASQGLGLLDELDVDSLLMASDRQSIKQAGSAFRGLGGSTLLSRLASDLIASLDLATMHKTPITVLARILRSEQAQLLSRSIYTELGWTQDLATQTHTDRLLWKAISLDLQDTEQQPHRVAGYDLSQKDNWGRSCSAILEDIHSHLLTTGKAATHKEAVLATSVLALNDHPEWLVSDIPDDLPYGATSVWVNFQHGVRLSEALMHGSSRWMSFKDLSELPAVFSSKMNSEEQQIAFFSTRAPSALLWAQVNGHLRELNASPYTPQEIEQALTALVRDEDQSISAVNALNTPAPDRRILATQAIFQARRTPEISDQLEQQNYKFPPLPLHPSLMLVPKGYPDVYQDRRDPPDRVRYSFDYDPQMITRQAYSLLDIYMSGEDIDDWRQPGTLRDEGLREVNTELRLLYKDLPFMPDFFEQSFQNWLKNVRDAYATLIKKLLIQLPFKHRVAIENGTVTLFSLRLPVQDVMASHENETHREPSRGRKGFIIQAVYDNQEIYYEVFPQQMIIVHRADLDALPAGGTLVTEFWQMSNPLTPYPTSTYAGKNLPFDWNAYSKGDEPRQGQSCVLIAEVIGATLQSTVAAGRPERLTHSTARCTSIVNTILDGLFYVNTEKLHMQCKGVTQVELKKNMPGELNRVASFLKAALWDPVEDLFSGEKERIQAGSLSVSLYLLPYGKPIGKLLSGSAHLAFRAGSNLFMRNAGSGASSAIGRFFSRLTSLSSRALPGKVAKGVGQFVARHLTWRFVASRAGITISRRLAAEARKFDTRSGDSHP
jgi:hypothetical protein